MEKSALRKEMLKTLSSFERKEEESKAICNTLINTSIYRDAETILSFVPLSSEPDISPLLNDERMLFPFITTDGDMEFGKGEMIKNKLGFYEPKNKVAVDYDKAIILVPLLACDKSFYRLGRGKGFYDRYINTNRDRLFSIALSFSVSFVESIDHDKWDERMDAIIVGGVIKYPQHNSSARDWI